MLIVTVQNISGLAPISDYVWEVRSNRETIMRGTLTGHRRADGWRVLLKHIANTAPPLSVTDDL